MKFKIIMILLLIFNLLLVYFFSVFSKQNDFETDSNNKIAYSAPLKQSLIINGKRLSDFQLKNMSLKDVKLSNYIKQEKCVLFVYSNIGCNSCTDSLIKFCNKLSENPSKNYQVIGVAYAYEIEYIRRFARINKLRFPFLFDKNKMVASSLNIELLPAILIINEKGEIISSFFPNNYNKELNSIFFNSVTKYLAPPK